jgi:hypothetical protein
MAKISSPAMLQWQLDRLIGQLMLVGDHAADQTCPCTYGYSDPSGKYVSESCIPKHLLAIFEYSVETEVMTDNEDLKSLLSDIAEQARGIRNAEIRKICGKEVEQVDITDWARDKRKLLEPHIYELACTVPEGEKTGTLGCCSYRMRPDGQVLLACKENGNELDGLYPSFKDAEEEAAKFCSTAAAEVEEVAMMFKIDKVDYIKSLLNFELCLSSLSGEKEVMDRANYYAKKTIDELDKIDRHYRASSLARDRQLEAITLKALGRKVPEYLVAEEPVKERTPDMGSDRTSAGFPLNYWEETPADFERFYSWIDTAGQDDILAELCERADYLGAHCPYIGTEDVYTELVRLALCWKLTQKSPGSVQVLQGKLEQRTMAAGINFADWLASRFSGKAQNAEIPQYIDVFKTTIAKHYRPLKDFHSGSIRVTKPEENILVYLGCLKSDDWDGRTCSPNPTVFKTIVLKNEKYRADLEHLLKVHPEIPVNYSDREMGVKPQTYKAPRDEEQEELEAVEHALENAEVVD